MKSFLAMVKTQFQAHAKRIRKIMHEIVFQNSMQFSFSLPMNNKRKTMGSYPLTKWYCGEKKEKASACDWALNLQAKIHSKF